MKIPILIDQLEINEMDVTIEEYLQEVQSHGYDIIRYPKEENPDLQLKVDLTIRNSDIIAYLIITNRDDSDFFIHLFTSIGNFLVAYNKEIVEQLNNVLNE